MLGVDLGSVFGLGCVKEAMVDVGPELLEDEGSGVDADVEAPLSTDVAEGALPGGVVEAGDSGGGTGSNDFADVEDFLAGVRASDERSSESVGGAFEEAAVAEGVEAVVLVSDGRDDEFDHVVFDGLVGGGVPEVAGIAEASSSELRRGVAGETDGCDGGGNHDGRVVE